MPHASSYFTLTHAAFLRVDTGRYCPCPKCASVRETCRCASCSLSRGEDASAARSPAGTAQALRAYAAGIYSDVDRRPIISLAQMFASGSAVQAQYLAKRKGIDLESLLGNTAASLATSVGSSPGASSHAASAAPHMPELRVVAAAPPLQLGAPRPLPRGGIGGLLVSGFGVANAAGGAVTQGAAAASESRRPGGLVSFMRTAMSAFCGGAPAPTPTVAPLVCTCGALEQGRRERAARKAAGGDGRGGQVKHGIECPVGIAKIARRRQAAQRKRTWN